MAHIGGFVAGLVLVKLFAAGARAPLRLTASLARRARIVLHAGHHSRRGDDGAPRRAGDPPPARPARRSRRRRARDHRDVEVCGTDVHLHHGRLAGVPFPIIPGHVSCGRVLETGGPLADVEGRPIATGAARDLLRRLRHLRRVLALPRRAGRRRAARTGASTASRRPADDGLLGGWAEQIEILPGVRLLPASRRRRPGRLHGRRLRTADRVPRGRARRDRARGHRRGPGQRPRRV